MSSTSTWIILILCSAYASSLPTTELPTTRRYNLLKGHNKIRTISKINTSNQNISAVLSYQVKPLPSNTKHYSKNKKNNTQLINSNVPNKTIALKKNNQHKKKGQFERVDISKPKNDTFGNHFYQIKLKKDPKHKNSSGIIDKNHLKQGWGAHNIPIPSPKPEISIYSPEYSLADAATPVLNEEDTVEIVSVNPDDLISQFQLDLTKDSEESISGCPNVHLTNSILGPSKKEACPDLNVAINTFLNHNQNPLPERLPSGANDLEAASSGGGTQIVPPPGLAASAPAAALDTLAAPLGGGGSNSASGGGPLSGLPSLPQAPQLPKLPDLKGVLDWLRLLGKGLGLLRGALVTLSPLLYIIPIISFLFGFITILPFYPWWLPLFFFVGKSKSPPKTKVVFHKHVHKPIHHHDQWFWNHNTKSWTNVLDRVRHKRSNNEEFNPFSRTHRIEQSQSWKRRKK